ncbi:MAG: hypothetical protein M3Z02_13275 [Actinomycetota bacterium]|nr:hypothetical protein [Actinomycetota bacterium]
MRPAAVLLAVGGLVGGLVGGGAIPAGAAASPLALHIAAAPGHGAPGDAVTLYVQGEGLPARLARLQVCGVPLKYSLDGSAQPGGGGESGGDGSDEGRGTGSSSFVTVTIPADATPTTPEITSSYWFWLSDRDCPKTMSLSTPPGQLSNRVLVRIESATAAPPAAPEIVPETQVLGERFTRPDPLPAVVPAPRPVGGVATATAAVAVSRAATFTG